MTLIKNISCRVVMALLAMSSLISCSPLYEYEGDCEPHYKVKFRFDKNMLYADAFSSQVGEVDLYVFDEERHLVWTGREEGEVLKDESYLMDLPLQPGKYEFIAWCRQRRDNASDFRFPVDGRPASLSDLDMVMDRRYEDGRALSDTDLHTLFHGRLTDVELPDSEGIHIVTLPLTKDTNSIRVMLVHLSGEEVKSDDFDFRITDSNGRLGYDNSILDDEPVEYHAWSKREGIAQTVLPSVGVASDSRSISEVHSLVAEMTVSRLQTSHRPVLTITRSSDGEKIVEIPVIDYFMMVKGEYNRQMDDDEFLDRQSDYSMTFFLNEDNTWYKAVIDILQWRVVLQNTDL